MVVERNAGMCLFLEPLLTTHLFAQLTSYNFVKGLWIPNSQSIVQLPVPQLLVVSAQTT